MFQTRSSWQNASATHAYVGRKIALRGKPRKVLFECHTHGRLTTKPSGSKNSSLESQRPCWNLIELEALKETKTPPKRAEAAAGLPSLKEKFFGRCDARGPPRDSTRNWTAAAAGLGHGQGVGDQLSPDRVRLSRVKREAKAHQNAEKVKIRGE